MTSITQKPMAYFDWSTLEDAWSAKRGSTNGEQAKHILEFVEQVAANRGITLSWVHLVEMVSGFSENQSKAEFLEKAKWIDSLNVTWIKNAEEIHEIEFNNLIRARLPLTASPEPESPFAPSFLTSLGGLTPKLTASFLKRGNAYNFVNDLLNDPLRTREIVGGGKKESVFTFAALHADRKNSPNQFEPESGMQILYQKADNEIKQEIQKHFFATFPDNPWSEDMFRGLEEDREVLRMIYLRDRTLKGLFPQLEAKDPASKGFRNEFGSFAFDLLHLSGGAYCHTFTCDKRTAKAMRGLRPRIGLPEAVSLNIGTPIQEIESLKNEYHIASNQK